MADVDPTPRNPDDHKMWTSTKLTGECPVKELCPLVALSTDASVAFVHQERAIYALSLDEGQWRRLRLPKSITDAPYQSIEGMFMYDQLLHVLIEKREGKTAMQTFDPATSKWDAPINIKKKMWCTSLTRSGSKVYSVDSWDGAVNVLDLSKQGLKWQTLTKEENELLKNLGSFSLIAYRQRLYLFGGKKGASEGSNDLYCFDIKKGQWSKVPAKGDVPPPRWGHSVVLAGGSFFIFGGINSMANLNDIYQFDIKKRRWRAVDALCPPPNGKCSGAAWISEDTLYRIAVKAHPNNDTLYAIDLDIDDGEEDEEVIETLQKEMKKMQKEMKKESKKAREEMQRMRDDMVKKHTKQMKKLKKKLKAVAHQERVISEDEILEKINKQLEEDLIKKEKERDNAQSMILTSTVDNDVVKEDLLKEVDELLNDELDEVKRELREELEETRNRLLAFIESHKPQSRDGGDEDGDENDEDDDDDHEKVARKGKRGKRKQEEDEEKEKEKDKEKEEKAEKEKVDRERERREAEEMKAMLRSLKDETERLRDEVAQLKKDDKTNSEAVAQQTERETTPKPEPELPSLPRSSNAGDLTRVMSLLGLSPMHTALDQRELDWKNAKLIGNGAFGHTKVFQTRWRGIECAVKRIKKESLHLSGLKAIQNDIDLIRRKAGLHPHLTYVYGTCDPPEGGIGVVMELAPYGSVRDLLVRQTRLPMSLLLSLAIDAAEGLQFMHSHQIPHKNITASSVMVSSGMRGMLSDFGLGKVNFHTRWMAPEMMPLNASSMPSEATDKAWMLADVWSFGVFLWEICTGQLLRPWQGSNDPQVITAVLSEGRSLAVPDECPPTLRNIIQCCWRRDPTQRPTAEELVDSLRQLLAKVVATEDADQVDKIIEPVIAPLPPTTGGSGSAPFSLASQGSSSSFSSPLSSDSFTANQSAWITARLKQEWRKSSPAHSPRAHLHSSDALSTTNSTATATATATAAAADERKPSTKKEVGLIKRSAPVVIATTTVTASSSGRASEEHHSGGEVDKKSALGSIRLPPDTGGKSRKAQATPTMTKRTDGEAPVVPVLAANNRLANGSGISGAPSLSSSSSPSSPYVPSFPSWGSSSGTRNRSRSGSLSSFILGAGDAAPTSASSLSSPRTASLRSSSASELDSGSSHASSLPSGAPSPDSSPPAPTRREHFSQLPSFSLHSSTDGEDYAGSRGPRSGLNSSASSLQDEAPSPPHSPTASRRPQFSPLPTRLFG